MCVQNSFEIVRDIHLRFTYWLVRIIRFICTQVSPEHCELCTFSVAFNTDSLRTERLPGANEAHSVSQATRG